MSSLIYRAGNECNGEPLDDVAGALALRIIVDVLGLQIQNGALEAAEVSTLIAGAASALATNNPASAEELRRLSLNLNRTIINTPSKATRQ